jgi:hypothetical protein
METITEIDNWPHKSNITPEMQEILDEVDDSEIERIIESIRSFYMFKI